MDNSKIEKIRSTFLKESWSILLFLSMLCLCAYGILPLDFWQISFFKLLLEASILCIKNKHKDLKYSGREFLRFRTWLRLLL